MELWLILHAPGGKGFTGNRVVALVLLPLCFGLSSGIIQRISCCILVHNRCVQVLHLSGIRVTALIYPISIFSFYVGDGIVYQINVVHVLQKRTGEGLLLGRVVEQIVGVQLTVANLVQPLVGVLWINQIGRSSKRCTLRPSAEEVGSIIVNIIAKLISDGIAVSKPE